jgi:transposase, IS30 family
MSYKHFTIKERFELSALLKTGKLSQKEIAEEINKSESSISREIRRNSIKDGRYLPGEANQKTKERYWLANQRFRKIENNEELEKYIIARLRKSWSPEQIAGRLNNNKPIIHHETIYQYIYKKNPVLVKYLRCKKGRYRRRYGTKIRENRREKAKLDNRRIDKRSKIIEDRKRIGDWEGDTIVGEEKTKHILTHVDRKSGYLLADKLERATAEETKKKTIARFKKLPKKKRYSFTYDNGSTFAQYELTEKELDINIYFAYPYHSWERGTNENTNGLLRQFFPKKTPFAKVRQRDIDRAVKLINNRPRKRLNYLTPHEVFNNINCTSD